MWDADAGAVDASFTRVGELVRCFDARMHEAQGRHKAWGDSGSLTWGEDDKSLKTLASERAGSGRAGGGSPGESVRGVWVYVDGGSRRGDSEADVGGGTEGAGDGEAGEAAPGSSGRAAGAEALQGWDVEEMELLQEHIEAGAPPWMVSPAGTGTRVPSGVVLAPPTAASRRTPRETELLPGVKVEEVHGHALASTRAHLGRVDGDGIREEVKAGMAAEVCARAAVQAYVGFGGDTSKSKAMGRALASDAVRGTGLDGEAAARAVALVGLAVDCTVDFAAHECVDLVDMARGAPPGRAERAVKVGVRVAFGDLAALGCGVGGTSAEAAQKAAEKGQQVAQVELEAQVAAAGVPRGQALLDHEAVAVWVALGRGVTGAFTLENPPWMPPSKAGDWDDAEQAALAAALECLRGHYGRPGASLELTAEEAARAVGGEAASAVVPGVDAYSPLLHASRYFCATYVRWYFEHRSRAEATHAMDAAAAVIQAVFRSHATGKVQQQADARKHAEAIRSRALQRGEEVRIHASWVVRMQARIRGRAARVRVKALRARAQADAA